MLDATSVLPVVGIDPAAAYIATLTLVGDPVQEDHALSAVIVDPAVLPPVRETDPPEGTDAAAGCVYSQPLVNMYSGP